MDADDLRDLSVRSREDGERPYRAAVPILFTNLTLVETRGEDPK